MHINKELLLECHRRMTPYIHRTPILSSGLIDGIAGARLLFKCENFQKMGAFKMRGAINAVLSLSDAQKAKGVVTHSSGNFAQALSLAAGKLGVAAHIVMPKNAPRVKVEAVKAYGGIITFCEATIGAREKTTQEIMLKTGATFIHPSNDLEVILGNATAGMELLEAVSDLDDVVTPVGGGGLLAGTGLAFHFFGAGSKVIGAEPINADDAYRSMQSGTIEINETAHTIADGLRTHLGDVNFPLIQAYVDEIITVEEAEIVHAMRLIYERLKIVVEPSSAVALAAVLRSPKRFSNKTVGIILSGGNVDLAALPF